MNKKIGRPTQEPKNLSTRIRMSEKDIIKLNYCCEKTGKLRSEIIREGIENIYNELVKKS